MKQLNRNSSNISVLLLIAVMILMGVILSFTTSSFLSWKNVVNILEASSFRILLAVGMMLIISSGAIDLSVGSILSLSAVVMAMMMKAGLPVWGSVTTGLLTGIILGVLNGTIISVTRINSLIVTLATAYLFRGVSLILTKGRPVTGLPQSFRAFASGDLFGVESGVTMAVIVLIVIIPVFYMTKWGLYLTGLGGNPQAIRRSGVSLAFYRISSFAVMGFLAAMAGMIITSRLNSAETNAGLNMEMDAICAVIMGGTPLHGGRGNLAGTVAAVLLLGMIRNGLTLLSVSPYYQQFITGLILLFAVIAAEIRERRTRIA